MYSRCYEVSACAKALAIGPAGRRKGADVDRLIRFAGRDFGYYDFGFDYSGFARRLSRFRRSVGTHLHSVAAGEHIRDAERPIRLHGKFVVANFLFEKFAFGRSAPFEFIFAAFFRGHGAPTAWLAHVMFLI